MAVREIVAMMMMVIQKKKKGTLNLNVDCFTSFLGVPITFIRQW